MDELLNKVKKELREIGEKGVTAANLDVAFKLADIAKDLEKIKKMEREEREEEEGGYGMRSYRGGYPHEIPGPYWGDHGGRDNYREGWRVTREGGNYGARDGGGYSARGGRYGHDKMAECLDKIANSMDMYSQDKERYHGDDRRVIEGLETMMFGICMFVESAMDFAETAEEKEIIRKHIRKLQQI